MNPKWELAGRKMDSNRTENRHDDMREKKRERMNEKGFTLIEMVLVATLIAILSTLAVASLAKARNQGFETGAAKGLKAIAEAEEMYYMDNGRYAHGFSALATTYLPRSYSADAFRGEFIKNYSLQWVIGGGGGPRPPITDYSVHQFTVYAIPVDTRLKTFVITDDGVVNRVTSNLFDWSPY